MKWKQICTQIFWFPQHHVSIQCGKTCLSGPVADDKCSHTQADDEVGIYDELQAWFFL